MPADLPRILSEGYGFRLIEDTPYAIGSTYRSDGDGYACGCCAHTDMAIFSFHPVKSIATGEGGAILTNDDQLADKLRHLANHGIERDPSKCINRTYAPHRQAKSSDMNIWYYEMHPLGYNGRLTDIRSALGLSQLRRLNQFKARRQKIVRACNQAFKELEEEQIVILPPWP